MVFWKRGPFSHPKSLSTEASDVRAKNASPLQVTFPPILQNAGVPSHEPANHPNAMLLPGEAPSPLETEDDLLSRLYQNYAGFGNDDHNSPPWFADPAGSGSDA